MENKQRSYVLKFCRAIHSAMFESGIQLSLLHSAARHGNPSIVVEYFTSGPWLTIANNHHAFRGGGKTVYLRIVFTTSTNSDTQ